MRRRVAATVLVSAALWAVGFGQAADTTAGQATTQPAIRMPPKPTVVPLHWQFDIELDQLRSIPIALPGNGKARQQLFWYLRYTVTNNSGEDHIFVPEFVLYTSTGQLIRAGRRAPTSVFYQIKKLHNDPMLKTQTSMTRKVLCGQDNAKSGVAIWPDFDARAGSVDIFITGLSGETKAIDLPKPIQVVETDWKGQKRTVTKTRLILAKTLHLHYAIPGEKAARRDVVPKLVTREWVMR
jgi:hypothetical protein